MSGNRQRWVKKRKQKYAERARRGGWGNTPVEHRNDARDGANSREHQLARTADNQMAGASCPGQGVAPETDHKDPGQGTNELRITKSQSGLGGLR